VASENKPAANSDDVPEELKPTVLLMSVMVKFKVAPVVDEDDQEVLQEKLSELFSDENVANMVNAYLEDDENVKELGFEESDVDLITENVVYEVAD
jgi:hypothetical protein